jgi:hypothetical protein
LSSSGDDEDKFDYKKDFFNFMTDPKVREQRLRESNGRSLLIGGGSEPRVTLLLDQVQFLNNSLTTTVLFPTLVANGLVDINTKFADVTMTECLFKDNYFPRAIEHVCEETPAARLCYTFVPLQSFSQSKFVVATK